MNPKLKTTYAYYLSFISLGLLLSVFGPTLSDLADQTNSRLSDMGFLFTIRSLGALLGTFLAGYLYDHRKGHPIFSGSLLIAAVGLALTPITPYLALLAVVFLLMGVAEGGINVGGNTLIVWLHGANVTPHMNALHFFFGVGSFLCPVIIAQAGGLQTAYWALAILMLPAAVWVFRLPSPVNETRVTDAHTPINGQVVFWIALFFFFMAGGNYTYSGWLVTYATELNIADKTTATYFFSAYMGAVTVGRLLAIPIATRVRPVTILLVDIVGMFLSACFLMVFRTELGMWVGAILSGLAVASVFPTMMSYAGTRVNLSANITSLFMVGVSVGGMIFPLGMGYVFEAGNAAWLMPFMVLNMVVVMGIFLWLHFYAEQPNMIEVSL